MAATAFSARPPGPPQDPGKTVLVGRGLPLMPAARRPSASRDLPPPADAELAGLWQAGEDERRTGASYIIDALLGKSPLKPGLDRTTEWPAEQIGYVRARWAGAVTERDLIPAARFCAPANQF